MITYSMSSFLLQLSMHNLINFSCNVFIFRSCLCKLCSMNRKVLPNILNAALFIILRNSKENTDRLELNSWLLQTKTISNKQIFRDRWMRIWR